MCVLICGSDQICLKSFGNFEHENLLNLDFFVS